MPSCPTDVVFEFPLIVSSNPPHQAELPDTPGVPLLSGVEESRENRVEVEQRVKAVVIVGF